jgi:AcrR family transcriptional regulator/DNA-binding XRE family transcriptional regulator
MFRVSEQTVPGAAGSGLGGVVRRARHDARLTLRQLADKIGVSAGTMSAIENDKVVVTVPRLQEIALVVGVPVSALLIPSTPAGPSTEMSVDDRGKGVEWRMFTPLRLDPVLAAAVEVFRETGYHGATMRTIAVSADISVAGIYHHYRSKQSLLVALVDLAIEDLAARVQAAAVAEDPVQRFRDIVEAIALFHAVRGDLAFIVATETRSLEAGDRRRIAEVRRRLQATLDKAALDSVATGAFRSAIPRHTARTVATMCMALPYWYSSAGAQSPSEIAAEYADLALTMMRHQVD